LQKKLDLLGYRSDIDGIFGKYTRGVVKQFQADFGLNPDGVVGPKTWAVLDRETFNLL
jgi:N-acetylmuramoyl-L-alanine amidase